MSSNTDTTEQRPTGMTYARSRLWLGILGVGLQVVLALTLLISNLPQLLGDKISVAENATFLSEFSAIILLLFIVASIQLPFDFLGGYVLPTQYGRNNGSAKEVFIKILAGSAMHTGLLACFFALYLLVGKFLGTTALIFISIGISLLLKIAQKQIASLIGLFPLQRADTEVIPVVDEVSNSPLVAQVHDTAFVGGVVANGMSREIILPGFWRQLLTPSTMRFALTRRAILLKSPSSLASVLAPMSFNLVGLLLFLNFYGSGEVSVSLLIQLSCWSTIWSFCGLLILPSLNRPAVFTLDGLAVARGIPLAEALTAIDELDKLQDEEPARSVWVERIFHPIPSAESRKEALVNARVGTTSTLIFHQLVRTMLYLSWANLNLLSRAVHCNVGKPECWVLFPGD